MADAYGKLVEGELAAAAANSQELSRRSLAVVSTSGGFVTLLSALIGFASINNKTAVFPVDGRGPLTFGIAAFVVAAVLALVVQLPLLVTYINVEDLHNVVGRSWGDSDEVAGREVARARVRVLATARSMNTLRSWFLVAAVVAEVAAIAASGVMAIRVVGSLAGRTSSHPPASAPARGQS
ncbi:MAG TPA: hypothetical protein VIP09_04610 [Dehalococcoidia bacterium]|jgi:hypothetical protein